MKLVFSRSLSKLLYTFHFVLRLQTFNSRPFSGEESEKENEIEALRERNRQLALNLRDSQADLEGSERKNAILVSLAPPQSYFQIQ